MILVYGQMHSEEIHDFNLPVDNNIIIILIINISVLIVTLIVNYYYYYGETSTNLEVPITETAIYITLAVAMLLDICMLIQIETAFTSTKNIDMNLQ